MQKKTKTYSYKGLPLFTCQEGSLLDLYIRDIQKQRMKRNTKHISTLIHKNMPIALPKPSKNILDAVIEG